MYSVLLLLLSSPFINGLPRQNNVKNVAAEPRQLLYIIERLENGLDASQQQRPQQQQLVEKQPVSETQKQPVSSDVPYNIAYLEPQLQYPGFNFLQDKQLYPRVQPQIVFYGPGGQGQPILINPGSPPGNFLVPHQPQPGPNVIIRDIPQRPVFVAGYPKPAHIPPIEKDAEEIPTNPAKIPPFPSTPTARKPEKLETFNEGKFEYPTKSAGEADVLAAGDRNPQLIPGTSLKPGHRFFILNGEDLFTNFPLPNNRELNLKYTQNQPEQIQLPLYPQSQNLDKQSEIDINNIPVQTLLLRNAVTGQISNVQDLNSEAKLPENYIGLNQPSADQALFRSGFPINIGTEDFQPIGQFRYSAPSEPYFSFDGDDFENDAVVIDAKADDADDNKDNEASSPQKESEPSTAQAAPGAIALAGPGGVAGAAPKGTALVGRGGLAISSPQATAVAGPTKNEEKTKKSTKKN
ncbi:uncharacterized protein LOC108910241 [Anoplophora glabripennis]|uniref:uncharacterized protein LOC108910241 n=1 Tax=Anoplophora glabripennis TaxID=217634 RepID=UPI0008740EBC|nr:uncharacterized protein LOC108910241 [Anoplophora glabripennis]